MYYIIYPYKCKSKHLCTCTRIARAHRQTHTSTHAHTHTGTQSHTVTHSLTHAHAHASTWSLQIRVRVVSAFRTCAYMCMYPYAPIYCRLLACMFMHMFIYVVSINVSACVFCMAHVYNVYVCVSSCSCLRM